MIKNRGTGAGGYRTTLHGLKFEEKNYLEDLIRKNDYHLKNISTSKSKRVCLWQIYNEKGFIGYYGRQGQIYEALKLSFPNITNEKIKKVFSKKINPDGFILNKNHNILYIFEKKWQQCSGSVDEKIQTAPFKVSMFRKLLSQEKIRVQYHYILSNWFSSPQYRNIKEYYDSFKEIELWIGDLNLKSLDIKKFLD